MFKSNNTGVCQINTIYPLLTLHLTWQYMNNARCRRFYDAFQVLEWWSSLIISKTIWIWWYWRISFVASCIGSLLLSQSYMRTEYSLCWLWLACSWSYTIVDAKPYVLLDVEQQWSTSTWLSCHITGKGNALSVPLPIALVVLLNDVLKPALLCL